MGAKIQEILVAPVNQSKGLDLMLLLVGLVLKDMDRGEASPGKSWREESGRGDVKESGRENID